MQLQRNIWIPAHKYCNLALKSLFTERNTVHLWAMCHVDNLIMLLHMQHGKLSGFFGTKKLLSPVHPILVHFKDSKQIK